MLTDKVERWRDGGAIEEVLGRRLFVHRREGAAPPLLLFLHDFPSSSYDWRPVLELRGGRGEARLARTAVLDGLRALRPDVGVVELPGAAHYPQIEQPGQISAALDTALGRAPH